MNKQVNRELAPEKISVVIPNWNGARFLRPCLESLRQQTYGEFVVYVVDNGSRDESVELIEKEFPEVVCIALKDNLGFAGGMNRGFEAAKGELLIALNNDTVQDPGWLTEVAAFFDGHPDVGFAASKAVAFDNHSVLDSIGDIYSVLGFGNHIGSGEADFGQYDGGPFEVFSASGVASIYRRALLDEVGGFDEDFFAYMEDIDLGIRARMAGYRCMAIPSAIIYHMGSATSSGGFTPFTIRLTCRNAIGTIVKNMPWFLVPIMLLLSTCIYLTLVVLDIVLLGRKGILRNLPSLIKGYGEAARLLPSMLKKRRALRQSRRISDWDWFVFMMQQSLVFFRVKFLKRSYVAVEFRKAFENNLLAKRS